MELWFLTLVSICIAALLKAILDIVVSYGNTKIDSDHLRRLPLPPRPASLPLISRFVWLWKSSPEMEKGLRSLRSKLGPIVTLHIASRQLIFIFSRSLAYKALVQNGAVFADRPKPLPTSKILSSNQHNINSSGYGEKWRILRRNLTSHILHPSRVKSFSAARSWVLQILLQRLRDAQSPVKVIDHFRYAMFCLLVFMCFGDKLDEQQIRKIEAVHQRLLLSFRGFQILNFHPWITKLVFRRRWRELYDLKKALNDAVIPRIRARKQSSQVAQNDAVPAYVDSLLELDVPGDGENGTNKRKMTEEEMVVACSEFLNAGTDTTSTALQWIMANLVKNEEIQNKLYNEILGVVGSHSLQTGEEIKEEDLDKMEYLKAVVLEGLRRHPPGHFVLPHAVTQQVELAGYLVPKNAVINFMVADMGWDPEVWEDPMEFKPERFLGVDFDINCSREIKMMPFGAGRRICPGLGLALLHLEYFVANLVWQFEWREVDGYAVDLTEKPQFTVVMKHPLHAQITPRCHP